MISERGTQTEEGSNPTPAVQVGLPADVAWEAARSANANLSTKKVPLGEELPIFCEKCGYCLHGVAQHVCDACSVRQFHCPECGHHQPINTLRPAAQKILGRVRAFFLTLSMLFRINFFGWLLFAWVGMGYEWSYSYDYQYMRGPGYSGSYGANRLGPRALDLQQVFAFGLFALFFGMFSRMLLLRWRRGFAVGLVLSVLVCAAVWVGAIWRKWDRESYQPQILPSPVTTDFMTCLLVTVASLTLGTVIVWGIWSTLAHIFLPRATCEALLEWQRSQSNESASFLSRTGRSERAS
jgi:hypothetical protein